MLNVKKIIFSLLTIPTIILSFLTIPSCTLAAPMSFADVAEHYLSSYPTTIIQPVPQQPAPNTVPQFTIFKEEDKTDYIQRKIIFSLFHSLNVERYDQKNYININKELLLILLSDATIIENLKEPGKHLASRINRTQTVAGEAILMYLLANPLTDIDHLEKMQEVLVKLITEPDFYNQIDRIVQQLKSIETNILLLLDDREPLTKKLNALYINPGRIEPYDAPTAIQKVMNLFVHSYNTYQKIKYAPSPILNKSAIALDIANRYESLIAPPLMLAQMTVSLAAPITALAKIVGFSSQLTNRYLYPHETLENLSELKKIRFSTVALPIVIGSYPTLLATMIVLSPFSYAQAQHKAKEFSTLQAALVDLKTMHNLASQANGMLIKNEAIQSLLPAEITLTEFSKTATSTSLSALKKILFSSSFTHKDDPSLPFQMGSSLVALKELDLVRAHFIEALYILGHLDAYLSIATLYKEFESQQINYCLPEYAEQATPLLELESAWNPFVDPTKVVPNSLILGSPDSARNMILTGSNAGGKSTFMKSCLYNIYLAQTIGIAPSKRMNYTIFHYLGSSLNVSDSQSSETSTFMAEAMRAKELYITSQMGNPSFFVFLLIDELFKGTNPKSGSDACFIYAKRLSSLPYAMFLFASHFIPKITEVEAATNGISVNYKFETRDKERFKLRPGINTADTAPAILKEKFDDLDPHFFDEMEDLITQ